MKYVIEIRPTREPRTWELIKEFNYKVIEVPRRFRFDGASIPKGLRLIFPHGGAKLAAALVHDYCYRTGIVDKKTADKYFLEIMLANNVASWRAYSMYYGVKLGGHMSWKKHRRNTNG